MIIRSISVVSLLFSHLSSASSSRRKGGGGRIKMAVVDADWSPPPPSIAHTPVERLPKGPPLLGNMEKSRTSRGRFFFLEYEYEQVDKTKMFCVNFRWGFRGCVWGGGGGGLKNVATFLNKITNFWKVDKLECFTR